MSRIIETAEYKKKIADLTRQSNAIKAQKEELLLALQHLNISHQQGRIGQLEYSHKWSEILAGRTIAEYVANYDRQIYEIAIAKKTYLTKVRTLEREEKKASRGINLAATLMIILVLIAGIGIFNIGGITGFAVQDNTTTISNATIGPFSMSIVRSGNLSSGVEFGSLSIGTNNNNATANYNNESTPNGTTLSIIYSSDSDVPIDLCVMANNNLINKTLGTEYIGVGNMSWANDSSTSLATPALADKLSMTSSYVTVATYIEPGNSTYFRFWLDIPSQQLPGDYNNTVEFKAVQNTKSC